VDKRHYGVVQSKSAKTEPFSTGPKQLIENNEAGIGHQQARLVKNIVIPRIYTVC